MKTLLFSLLVITTTCTYSQDYIEVPLESMQWHYYALIGVDDNFNEYMIEYKASGETELINDISYTKIYNPNANGYIGSARNDEGKVYFIPEDSEAELQVYDTITEESGTETELLLYDFTLELGDTISNVYSFFETSNGETTYYLTDLRVDGLETVTINGIERREFYLTGLSGFSDGYTWIEGIGVRSSYFHEPAPPLVLGGSVSLRCAASYAVQIYGDPDPFSYCGLFFDNVSELISPSDIKIYPNPSLGKFSISIDKVNNQITSNDILIYNSLGELIQSPVEAVSKSINFSLEDYPAGIYSVNIHLGNQVLTNKVVKN